MSSFVYVRGVIAYLLDGYRVGDGAEELIACSTKAAYVHSDSSGQKTINFNDPKEPLNNLVFLPHQMKKMRYVGNDIVYGMV